MLQEMPLTDEERKAVDGDVGWRVTAGALNSTWASNW